MGTVRGGGGKRRGSVKQAAPDDETTRLMSAMQVGHYSMYSILGLLTAYEAVLTIPTMASCRRATTLCTRY